MQVFNSILFMSVLIAGHTRDCVHRADGKGSGESGWYFSYIQEVIPESWGEGASSEEGHRAREDKRNHRASHHSEEKPWLGNRR